MLSDLSNLAAELELASAEPDRPLRVLRVAAVIEAAVGTLGLNAVLVGGAALEFYTEAGYQTGDFDFVAPDHPNLEGVMAALGFEKRGHDYVHTGLDLWVEFPGSQLQPDERICVVETPAGCVRILCAEDILIDRIRAFVYWKSPVDGRNALLLMHTRGDLDLQEVAKKLGTENSLGAIAGRLVELAARVRRHECNAEEIERELRRVLEAR